MIVGRIENRSGFELDVRIRLLESDLDSIDQTIEDLGARLDKSIDELGVRLDSIRKTLVGVMISSSTALLLLAINLVIGI